MKYFNRHASMGMETLKEIGAIQNEFFEEPIYQASKDLEIDLWGLRNFLCGLYDGYDYTDQIKEDKGYKLIKLIAPEVAERIDKVLKEIEGYEKFDEMATQV